MFPLEMSRQLDLVKWLEFLAVTMVGQCRKPMPLLVDINPHYRLLKLCYGATYQPWQLRRVFANMPPVYGLWHVYKDAVFGVWRSFCTICSYAAHGIVGLDTHLEASPSLHKVERLFAALLTLPLSLKVGLRQAAVACSRAYRAAMQTEEGALKRHAELQQFILRNARRRGQVLAQEQALAGHGGGRARPAADRLTTEETDQLKAAWEQVEVSRDTSKRLQWRLTCLEAMVVLVDDYLPMVYSMGHDLRECQWAAVCRDRDSGTVGRRVVMSSLLVLQGLHYGAPFKDEYYRSTMVALLFWSLWYDSAPAAI